MKATIGHVGINLSSSTRPFKFWKELLTFLDFSITEEGSQHFDATDGRTYLCVGVVDKLYAKPGFHRKRIGLNHIAFRVASVKLVDRFVSEFLLTRKIQPLYGGAKVYPYVQGYYAVYFEDPDRIKVEVVFES
jgi:catechol 2,3-dioxygenase-like lactoylglutathione lyase family enzyme